MHAPIRKMWLSGLMALVAVVAALASGCAGNSVSRQPCRSGCVASAQIFHGMLNTNGANDLTPPDPAMVADTNALAVVNALFDGLVTLDAHLAVEDWGARKIDVSTDGLTYTFYLRPGQFFSDGTPVNASDYAYSINRSLTPCLASPMAAYLSAIKDAQTFNAEACHGGHITAANGQTQPVVQSLVGDSIVADDSGETLTVTLAHPAAYFLSALASSTSSVVEQEVVDPHYADSTWTDTLGQGATGQGGSGMFYLAGWDHRAGKIVLKSNPHWWGIAAGNKPHLQEIDWTLFKDAISALAAYQAGTYDMALVTPDQVAQAQRLRDYHQVPTLATYGVMMDWAQPPFDNVDAREALCLAIDRDAFVAAVAPAALLPTWHIVPQGMPGYSADLAGPDGVTSTRGAPDKARAHWQTYLKTLHGAPPRIAYSYPSTDAAAGTWAQALAQQWQTVLGVAITLTPYDPSHLPSAPVANQLERVTWAADYPDPRDILSLQLLSDSPFNLNHVDVPPADDLMRGADINPDQVVRMEEYQQAEQLLLNQVAWCPLFQSAAQYLVRPTMRNWFEDAQGVPPDDAWVAAWVSTQ
jgi:oligopeptide transport system substrate-binding protein